MHWASLVFPYLKFARHKRHIDDQTLAIPTSLTWVGLGLVLRPPEVWRPEQLPTLPMPRAGPGSSVIVRYGEGASENSHPVLNS